MLWSPVNSTGRSIQILHKAYRMDHNDRLGSSRFTLGRDLSDVYILYVFSASVLVATYQVRTAGWWFFPPKDVSCASCTYHCRMIVYDLP